MPRHIDGWWFPWTGDFEGKRLRLHDSAVVIAWPSTGGRLELQNPSVFELNVLVITDPFTESKKSDDSNDEDAFVHQLRRLGGVFYQYQYGIRKPSHRSMAEIHTWLGWPEDEKHKGGVWVLKLTKRESRERLTGRIRLATTMQAFYASPADEHLVSIKPVPVPTEKRVDTEQADDEWQNSNVF